MNFWERILFPKSKNRFLNAIRRPIAIILTFCSIVLVAFLLVNMILPELIECIQVLIDTSIRAFQNAVIWLEQNVSADIIPKESFAFIKNGQINLTEAIQKAASVLMTGVGGAMTSIVGIFSSVFSAIVTIIVSLIFSIYLLVSKEKLGEQTNRFMDAYLSKKLKEKVTYVTETLDGSFHNFIVGQCIEAVILGALCTIGMMILRLPYATMIGCLVGFTALIPVVGAFIGAAIGAFMIFTISPIQALVFVIFLLILQQLEGNIIYPRVVGASVGLPGIWVLVAVTIGGGILGIGGMLLAVPLFAAAYKMLQNDIEKRQKPKRKVRATKAIER
jgi:predicted PurR-regulated permease PerM